MRRKTKIVATLGPAVDSEQGIRELIEAGVNVARFNFSHGDHDDHSRRFAWVKETADELGLATFAPDEIDWEDELRLAIEERASFSPDALTGMEANLRFAGPETLETKIFGRLSAWQNWIFQRPNAVGPTGALTLYGRPERPVFNWSRT